MISPQAQETLKTLRNSAYGRALQEVLEEHMKKIDDVSTLQSWDEALGRKYAKALIRDMLYFLEKDTKIEKTKNQYE